MYDKLLKPRQSFSITLYFITTNDLLEECDKEENL